ncbi:hypothetical protein P8452_60817 [Trifolium repens]|nr:hypothetical protein P8452_60817 [Trifolium repens]
MGLGHPMSCRVWAHLVTFLQRPSYRTVVLFGKRKKLQKCEANLGTIQVQVHTTIEIVLKYTSFGSTTLDPNSIYLQHQKQQQQQIKFSNPNRIFRSDLFYSVKHRNESSTGST